MDMLAADDSGKDFGSALLFLGLAPFFIVFFVWLICAVVAGLIAQTRARSGVGFALATFFLLGPLGVGFALIAPRGDVEEQLLQLRIEKRRGVAEGRQRFICPRCGVENDIPNADTSYDCWRCSEHRTVKAKVAAAPAKS